MGRSRIVLDDQERVGRWVSARIGASWSSAVATAIGNERDGELMGGVTFDGYNGASVCMHVASNGSRRWLTRGFLRVVFLYAFEQLGVRKVIALVPSDNEAALKFDRHVGFVDEAKIADAHPGGDILILSMTRQQCRWI
jgi:RimJ/RimL family protein N-acetyltransferase